MPYGQQSANWWLTLKETVLAMKKSVRPFINKQTWLWTVKVQEKVKVNKTVFKNWIAQQTLKAQQWYIWAIREAKKSVTDTRLECYHDLYEWLDNKEGEKCVYRLAKMSARDTKDINHYVCIKEKEGQCLQERSKILASWEQHFNEICNVKFSHSLIPHGSATARPLLCIASVEVRKAIQCMKNNKAPGPHDLPADILKLGGLQEKSVTWLTRFF